MSESINRDYVLGTHDQEIGRLGLQHRVWRSRVLDAWSRAGIGSGQTVIDVGAGPGYASFDLAELVGPTGRVVAIERSQRFLAALEAERSTRGLAQLVSHGGDLDSLESFPVTEADAVWCRWVLAFVRDPRRVLRAMVSALRPGGVLGRHEYFDYATWRLIPPVPSFVAFVEAVMTTWRSEGGEPDIGLRLPSWLQDADVELISVVPYIDVARPGEPLWEWPAAFFQTGLDRLVHLRAVDEGRASLMRADVAAHAVTPGAMMMTPGVLEVVARKRGPVVARGGECP